MVLSRCRPTWPAVFGLIACSLPWCAIASEPPARVPLIFDTDIGNDVDDALALGVIHALQARGHCELLAVTITKDHALAAPFVDAINTFYGRGDVPIGAVRGGVTPAQGKFLGLAEVRDGDRLRYPRDLEPGAAEEAVRVLRRVLAGADDNSVVIAQVGFSTNLARLLDSGPDEFSPLNGSDLAARKVKLVSIMAGAFTKISDGQGNLRDHREYNVVEDLPAAIKLADKWPTPMIWSGFEIGLAIPYPSRSIVEDYRYVPHHPLAEAYQLYMPPPHDRPTWDLTSVLQGVLPDRGYFDLSPRGRVTVHESGLTTFTEDAEGRDRYLIATPDQRVRVTEALVQLSSQPPQSVPPTGSAER